MGILDNISFEQKIKAFEKARDDVVVPGAKLVLVTEEYYNAALQLFQEAFMPDEPITRSIQLKWSEEFKALTMSSLHLHLSVMFVHAETGEPMALRITRLFNPNFAVDLSNVQDEKFKKVFEFVNHVDNQVNFVDKMGGGVEAFHFLGLCVAKKYRHQGLGSKVFEAAMNLVKYLELDSVFVKGEGTSNYSKRIYEKFGFETVYEIKFADYVVNEEQVFCNTGEHKSMKTYVKEIK